MRKTILLLLIPLLIIQLARAQKRDSVIFYMKNNNERVFNKDSADYKVIIMPFDSTTALYPVYEYYPNGKIKMTTTAKFVSASGALYKTGSCTNYDVYGRKRSVVNYVNGNPLGIATAYFPDGSVYRIERFRLSGKTNSIECHDTTGKITAENGNGEWLDYNDSFTKIMNEGPVKDKLITGEWHGTIGDTGKYVCIYKKGKVVFGTGYDKNNKAHPFTADEIEPEYKGGKTKFLKYIKGQIMYSDSVNHAGAFANFQYYSTVNFEVDTYGQISHIRFITTTPPQLKSTIIKAVESTRPWLPGYSYGMAVKKTVQVTLEL